MNNNNKNKQTITKVDSQFGVENQNHNVYKHAIKILKK